MTTILFAAAIAFPNASADYRAALDALAGAKAVSFKVRAGIYHVALPEDPVFSPVFVGEMLLAKDGRWRWKQPDGKVMLFDGKDVWACVEGLWWKEDLEAVALNRSPITRGGLEQYILGMDIFLSGKWRGVKGRTDWVYLSQSKEDERITVARPNSPEKLGALLRDHGLADGVFLEFDSKTLAPVVGYWYSSNSYDREEGWTEYSEFRFNPSDAEELLKPGTPSATR